MPLIPVFLALLTVAVATVMAFRNPKTNQTKESFSQEPAVAGESIHIDASVANVATPTPAPTVTPTSTPSPSSSAVWNVKDTGKDSNPREMQISHESENAHVNTSVTTSASGNVDQSTNISVTVNGETREIKN